MGNGGIGGVRLGGLGLGVGRGWVVLVGEEGGGWTGGIRGAGKVSLELAVVKWMVAIGKG